MDNFNMGDKFSAFLYDAVLLYAISINESLAKGQNPRLGSSIFNNIRGKTFTGNTFLISVIVVSKVVDIRTKMVILLVCT